MIVAKDREIISSLCALEMIFSILYPMERFKQVTLSQQQFSVMNLVGFLNFNLKNLARFGTFHPTWLITLKISFTLEDAIRVK